MNGALKRALKGKLAQLAQDPDKLPGLAEYAQVVATIEHELALQAEERAELLGTEPPTLMDVEARQQQLMDLAAALMDESTGPLYVRELTTVTDDAAESAASYLGLGRTGWGDQVRRWADTWRAEAGEAVEDLDDTELAEQHVRATFGVDADAFREQVALVEPHEAERRLFQHRFDAIHDAHERANRALAELVEEDADL